MNDTSYMILIPVLFLLIAASGGMLYARFMSRSSGKRDEVDFDEIELENSIVPVTGEPGAEEMPVGGAGEKDPNLMVFPEVVSTKEKEPEKKGSPESEYFDELQEAAAGLAALMRSSPVGKSAPVVYAPEEVVEAAEDEEPSVESSDEPQEILLPIAESVPEVLDVAAGPEREAEQPVDAADELSERGGLGEPAHETFASGDDSAEAQIVAAEGEETEPLETPNSIRSLLGDEVVDQLNSLDDSLSDLEELVVSIESSLSSLNQGPGEGAVGDDELEAVSEAA